MALVRTFQLADTGELTDLCSVCQKTDEVRAHFGPVGPLDLKFRQGHCHSCDKESLSRAIRSAFRVACPDGEYELTVRVGGSDHSVLATVGFLRDRPGVTQVTREELFGYRTVLRVNENNFVVLVKRLGRLGDDKSRYLRMGLLESIDCEVV